MSSAAWSEAVWGFGVTARATASTVVDKSRHGILTERPGCQVRCGARRRQGALVVGVTVRAAGDCGRGCQESVAACRRHVAFGIPRGHLAFDVPGPRCAPVPPDR